MSNQNTPKTSTIVNAIQSLTEGINLLSQFLHTPEDVYLLEAGRVIQRALDSFPYPPTPQAARCEDPKKAPAKKKTTRREKNALVAQVSQEEGKKTLSETAKKAVEALSQTTPTQTPPKTSSPVLYCHKCAGKDGVFYPRPGSHRVVCTACKGKVVLAYTLTTTTSVEKAPKVEDETPNTKTTTTPVERARICTLAKEYGADLLAVKKVLFEAGATKSMSHLAKVSREDFEAALDLISG